MPETMEVKAQTRSIDWSKVEEALRLAARSVEPGDSTGGKADHVFPGAVLLVGCGGDVVFHQAVGCRSVQPEVSPMHKDIVFDIASLTKVVATTTLAMQLVDSGQLEVDRRLSRIFQSFGTYGKERMTVRHLLTHTSGYPATAPFYRRIAKADRGERAGIMTSRGAVETVYNEIFRSKIEHLPGKVTKYSDIGFLLLGHAIEVVSGTYLDKLVRQNILAPLGMQSTGFIDLAGIKRREISAVCEQIAPTAKCPWRGKILCGEVHDDNAWAMGGVAGHAGLFSSAVDLHLFATEMIDCWHGRGSLVSAPTVRSFWQRDETDPKSSWALGWDTPAENYSSAGQHFSRKAVGHIGYTGCSLWIDPERDLDVVLLSNRIHSSTDPRPLQTFRPVIHDLIMEALGL